MFRTFIGAIVVVLALFAAPALADGPRGQVAATENPQVVS